VKPLSSMLRDFPVRALNHLLAEDPSARRRLASHAGKTACIDVGVHAFNLRLDADGYAAVAEATDETDKVDKVDEAVPTVTIRIKPADLPLMLHRREQAASYVRIEGDAEFAHLLSQLSESLRWDAEADLARWIGDIGAVRAVAAARGVTETVRKVGGSLAQSVAEYLTEENPVLTVPAEIDDFGAQVRRLRDDVERLAKRTDGLEQSRP
jgi:ubiquinone biosynthesis accessory factor UbiJ